MIRGWLPKGWLTQSLSIPATLLGLLALTFFITRVLPLDPVLAVVGENADQATYQAAYERLGLDQPLVLQFAWFVGDILRGDFGTALFTGNRVAVDLARVFPATVELATFAVLTGALVGIPLGIIAAVRQGRLVDHVVRLFGLIGHSVPIFWLGLMGLVLFYAKLDWVGGAGRVDIFLIDSVPTVTGLLTIDAILAGDGDVLASALRHIALPGLLLGFSSVAFISRMTRSFALEQLAQEYTIAAQAKGFTEAQVVIHHVLPNIGVQLITVLALVYGGLLEGAVLTETVFAWPGFGQYLTHALIIGDMNATLACTLIVGLIFIGLNVVSDLLYRWLDPRTRA